MVARLLPPKSASVAISARDADAASLAMRYHLSKVVRSVIARLDDPKIRAHPL